MRALFTGGPLNGFEMDLEENVLELVATDPATKEKIRYVRGLTDKVGTAHFHIPPRAREIRSPRARQEPST